MSRRRVWIDLAYLATTTALIGSACGAGPAIDAKGESNQLECESDRDEIVELLRSGLPTYDYDPADDLRELIESSDVILSGSVVAVERSIGDPDPDVAENTWTVLSIDSPKVLYTLDEPVDFFEISYSSSWPKGAGSDPLAVKSRIDGLAFVAFLDRSELAPGQYAVDVQGLVVACSADEPAVAVIEPLPLDADGLPLGRLTQGIETISRGSLDGFSSGLDGPLMRHQRPPDTFGSEAAEITGGLELEGECLYLRPDGSPERYPIIWPAGSRWDHSRQVIVLPTGDEVELTDRVTGGGGYHDLAAVEATAGDEAAALTAGCLDNTYGETAIVNNDEFAIQRTG